MEGGYDLSERRGTYPLGLTREDAANAFCQRRTQVAFAALEVRNVGLTCGGEERHMRPSFHEGVRLRLGHAGKDA